MKRKSSVQGIFFTKCIHFCKRKGFTIKRTKVKHGQTFSFFDSLKTNLFIMSIWFFYLDFLKRLFYHFFTDKTRLSNHNGINQLFFDQFSLLFLLPNPLKRVNRKVLNLLIGMRFFIIHFYGISQSIES